MSSTSTIRELADAGRARLLNMPAPHARKDDVSARELAALLGLSRARVSQLRSEGILPPPDGRGSTPKRPVWRTSTVAGPLAAAGYRLDPYTTGTPWMLPGPDLSTPFQLAGNGYAQLHVDGAHTRTYLGGDGYRTRGLEWHSFSTLRPRVWLVCEYVAPPAAGGTSRSEGHIFNIARMEAALTDYVRREGLATDRVALLGSLVLSIPANDNNLYPVPVVRDVVLHPAGYAAVVPPERRVQGCDVLDDPLPHVLGHTIPMWPSVAASPALVSGWTPRIPVVPCPVPPGLSDHYRYSQMAATVVAAAGNEDEVLARDVARMGREVFRRPYQHLVHFGLRDADLPPTCHVAVSFPPADEDDVTPAGDLDAAIDWALVDPAVPAWFADMTYALLADRRYRLVCVDARGLPPDAARLLDEASAQPDRWSPPNALARRAAALLGSCTDVAATVDPFGSGGVAGRGVDAVTGNVTAALPVRTEPSAGRAQPPAWWTWLPEVFPSRYSWRTPAALVCGYGDGTFDVFYVEDPGGCPLPEQVRGWLTSGEGTALAAVVSGALSRGEAFTAPLVQVRALLDAKPEQM